MRTLVAAKVDPAYRHAPLVGVALDVALRLRDSKGHKDVAKTCIDDLKPAVNDYYLAAVALSKTAPPPHVLRALDDFFGATVTLDDAMATFVPALEKAMNRVAEPGLVNLEAFLAALPPAVAHAPALRTRLAPAVLAPTKSVSAPTRAAATRVFATLFSSGAQGDDDEATLAAVAEQVYAPLRTGKTTSPDHRTALYTLLAALPPSAALSPEVVATALGALAKESNEATFAALMRALERHLPRALEADVRVPQAHVAALVKSLGETKPALRRRAQAALGSVFWALEHGEAPSGSSGSAQAAQVTGAERAFGEELAPAWEAALKTVATNLLNSPSGPLEGYVAVAVLKSRALKWDSKKISASASRSPCATRSPGPD